MTVQITSPTALADVKGTVTVTASLEDSQHFKAATLLVDPGTYPPDGKQIAETRTLPIRLPFDSTKWLDGPHQLRVSVHVKNHWEKANVTVNVKNMVAPPPPPDPPPVPPPVGSSRGTGVNRQGGSFTLAQHYERFGYIIVGPQNAAAAGAIAGVKTLAYMAPLDVNRYSNYGTDWAWANQNGKLLKDQAGHLLVNIGYTDNNLGDVGDPEFQQRFAKYVGDFCVANSVDGVFLDDVTAALSAPFAPPGEMAVAAKYPSQPLFEAAMASCIHYVGQTLRARGLEVVCNAGKFVPNDPNSNNANNTASFWRRIGPDVTGLLCENWLTENGTLRGLGTEWWNNFDSYQGLVAVAQSVGCGFFGLHIAQPDSMAAIYGRAAFLLDWDGKKGAMMINPSGEPGGAWAKDLGAPLAPKSLLNGVWSRPYELGTPWLNPSTRQAGL